MIFSKDFFVHFKAKFVSFQGADRATNLQSLPGEGFRKPSNLKQKPDGTAGKKGF